MVIWRNTEVATQHFPGGIGIRPNKRDLSVACECEWQSAIIFEQYHALRRRLACQSLTAWRVSGYPDYDTEAKVQADIVDAGYATTSLTSGPELIVNSTISLQVTTSGYTDRYLAHTGSTVNTQQASWRVRTGLGNSDCLSFESVDTPGSYIRHSGFELYLSAIEDAQRFYEDATFCPMTALSGSGNSVRSWSYPTRFIRHFNNVGYIASNGGVQTFDAAKSFNADATWLVISGFAS
ncbi:unnamed protein product [Aspergillus udagawae]|nr:unnamed protein product [Aspergillus udagawae]